MDYSVPLITHHQLECKGKRVGDYLYDADYDTLYYELPYPFPVKFAVIGLNRIYATPGMLRLPTFLKYHNIDWLRQQLMQIKCVMNDAVLLHGSAWEKNGRGYLAVGMPNCGKTSMLLREVRNGAMLCADENVIITKAGEILPVRRRTSLNPWIAKEVNYPLTRKQKTAFVLARIKAKLFPIFEPNIWVDLPIGCPTHLDEIIYLTPGKQKTLALLTDNEFPFYTNPVIQSYAYAAGFDLDAIYEKYRELLNVISFNTEPSRRKCPGLC